MSRTWPWRDGDVVTACLAGLLGGFAVGVAWFGASGTSSIAAQAVWLNVAVGGLMVCGFGIALWLLRGRRSVGERRADLVSLADAVPSTEPTSVGLPPAETAGGTEPLLLVRAPGMRRAHDPGCPLVAGKEIERVAIGTGERCEVCTS